MIYVADRGHARARHIAISLNETGCICLYNDFIGEDILTFHRESIEDLSQISLLTRPGSKETPEK